jgi:hypothetical protein
MKKILIVALILTTSFLSFSQTKTKSKKTTMKKATLTIVDESKSPNSQTAYSVSRSILEVIGLNLILYLTRTLLTQEMVTNLQKTST